MLEVALASDWIGCGMRTVLVSAISWMKTISVTAISG